MDYEKCSQCKTVNKIESMIHCCNPSYLVCPSCRRKNKCITCGNKYPQKSKCMMKCHCKPSQINKKVNLRRGLTPLKKCQKCKMQLSLCTCIQRKPNFIIRSSKQQEQQCDICYKAVQSSELIYNSCGHMFCSTCLKQLLNQDPSICFCRKKLDNVLNKKQSKTCFSCNQQFSGKNFSQVQQFILCKNCKLNQQKSYKQMSMSTINTSLPASNKLEQIQLQKSHQKQSKSKSGTQKQTQITQLQLEKNKIMNSLFNSDGKRIKQTKKSELNLSQNLSKNKRSQPELKQTQYYLCNYCNIQYHTTLLDYPKCLQKKHKICKLCFIQIQTKKLSKCIQCQRILQQQFQKRFIYIQLKGNSRKQYCENMKNNKNECSLCLIITDRNQLFDGKCRLCFVK